jgi:hypothetical protein
MFDSAPRVSGILAQADLRESPPYRSRPLPRPRISRKELTACSGFACKPPPRPRCPWWRKPRFRPGGQPCPVGLSRKAPRKVSGSTSPPPPGNGHSAFGAPASMDPDPFACLVSPRPGLAHFRPGFQPRPRRQARSSAERDSAGKGPLAGGDFPPGARTCPGRNPPPPGSPWREGSSWPGGRSPPPAARLNPRPGAGGPPRRRPPRGPGQRPGR